MWLKALNIRHLILGIVLFVALRWAAGGFDFSFFINAGTSSCDSTVTNIIVQKGYNFDGLFFYRYALNPFNTDNPYMGISVADPVYRHQRILYPLLSWALSAGGIQPILPFVLVLVNTLAFIFCITGTGRLLKAWNITDPGLFIAVCIPGIWMGLARDLAEPLEICSFIHLLLAYKLNKKAAFTLLATAMIFARETSAIVLLAFCISQAWDCFKARKFTSGAVQWVMAAVIPVIAFVLFRSALHHAYAQTASPGSFTLDAVPFRGLVQGFEMQWNEISETGLKGVLKLAFSVISLAFLSLVLYLAFSSIKNKPITTSPDERWLMLIMIMWMLFSVFFGVRIWVTDWGFLRALDLPLFGALLICVSRKRLPAYAMNLAGVYMVILLVRLIAKV